jgi:DNA-binding transcriptional ArsR family regulator
MSTTAEVLDARFSALADPTRLAIIARLAKGEATVTELGAPFTISQPAITKHLKVLERAGFISRGRDAQRRPCRLRAEAIRDVAEWTETYRQFWEQSYERIDGYLEELKGKGLKELKGKGRKHGRRKP